MKKVNVFVVVSGLCLGSLTHGQQSLVAQPYDPLMDLDNFMGDLTKKPKEWPATITLIRDLDPWPRGKRLQVKEVGGAMVMVTAENRQYSLRVTDTDLVSQVLATRRRRPENKLPLRINVTREQTTQRELIQRSQTTATGVPGVSKEYAKVEDTFRALNVSIAIQNGGLLKGEGLIVRYVLFVRAGQLKGSTYDNRPTKGRLEAAFEGEQTVDIEGLKTLTIRTEGLATKWRDSSFGSRWGTKYYGTVVRVYRDNELVAAYAEPSSLDKEMIEEGYLIRLERR
jgi:hypothetical protein